MSDGQFAVAINAACDAKDLETVKRNAMGLLVAEFGKRHPATLDALDLLAARLARPGKPGQQRSTDPLV